MLPLAYLRRWRTAGVLLLSAALAVALMPNVWPDIRMRDIVRLDQWLHGLGFLLLALWFSGQYGRRAYWRLALGLLAFGGVIELCQYLTTYRHAEWRDLYADAAGIVVGLAIGWAGAGGWSLRLEQWLAQRR